MVADRRIGRLGSAGVAFVGIAIAVRTVTVVMQKKDGMRSGVRERMARLVVLLVVLSAAMPVGAAFAQAGSGAVTAEQLGARWDAVLERIENSLQGKAITPEQHAEYNVQLKTVESEAGRVVADAEKEMETHTRQLEALGAPPSEGEPPEAAEIKAEREALNAKINGIRSRVAQAELTRVRAEELETALSAAFRKEFRERLLVRGPLPLSPNTLAKAGPEALAVFSTLTRSWSDWLAGLSPDQLAQLRWRGPLAVLVVFAAWSIRRFLLKRYGRDTSIQQPSYPRRFVAAVVEGFARGIVPASIFAIPLVMIPLGWSLISGLLADVVDALCLALIIFTVGSAMTRAVLAPDLPEWRCTGLAPRASRTLAHRIIFLLAVFAIDVFINRGTQNLVVSSELLSLYAAIVDSVEAVGIVLLIQGWLWRTEPETAGTEADGSAPTAHARSGPAGETVAAADQIGGRFWAYVRRAVGAAAVVGVVANLIGYVNLGDKLIDSLMISGVIIGTLFLIRKLLQELIGVCLGSNAARQWLGLRDKSRDLVGFWLNVVLDLLLISGGFFLVLPIWGVPRTDLMRWIRDALEGFTVGGVTISLMDIVTALLVFVGAVAVTRLARQTLSDKVLSKTSLDTGIRNSLTSGISYVGVTIAALLAVGIMGVDFQNIAIIAGALSVGIGFGLQNIVNNFVSGLILLIERPIKIGDWVVVGENQGFVRKISVRATEIETFDRASVILPNSELLSTAVVNWTHKDKIGRLIVMVGVAYGSDTQRVREILLACAKEHPDVLSWPQPFVLFRSFGGSSLDFEVYAFLRDIDKRLIVGSDLRFAIDRAFREEGIEIPFSQHDIHFRDMERLEQALAAFNAARTTGVGEAVPPRSPERSAGRSDDDHGGPSKGDSA